MKLKKTIEFLKSNIVGERVLKPEVTLHHFGIYNIDSGFIEQPMWVSHQYSAAKDYENHAACTGKQIYYSTFKPLKDLKIANLGKASLMQACMSVGIYNHEEWNALLAEALKSLGFDGLVYIDNEIHISQPQSVLIPISSNTTWE